MGSSCLEFNPLNNIEGMNIDYRDFCEGKIVENVWLKGESGGTFDKLLIGFKDTESTLKIEAVGDCCSYSWLHFLDDENDPNSIDGLIESAVGKQIKLIDTLTDRDPDDLPESDIQECDSNHLVRISFGDGSHYDFVLRNSSNGFYDGWIDIRVYKN